MIKRKKRHIKKTYLSARRHHLADDGLGAISMSQFSPAIFGAIAGIGASFIDNMLNIDGKIKGAAMVVGSAFLPVPESVKGAIAGKGGEIIAKSMGILSDELDGFIAVSEDEISEIADAIAEEMADEVINDNPEVIQDAELLEVINDAQI
jgi:phage-related protein